MLLLPVALATAAYHFPSAGSAAAENKPMPCSCEATTNRLTSATVRPAVATKEREERCFSTVANPEAMSFLACASTLGLSVGLRMNAGSLDASANKT